MDNDEKIKEYETHKTPVLSYDEWFKIKYLASLSECLQEKNIECLHRENKLKELLKECESSIQYYQETYGAMDLDTYTLLAKLKEVLK